MQRVELARLSRQCQAIATRLQAGPATNRELSGISLKYTSRISDLRDRGWDVQVMEQDRASGLTWYALQEPAAIQAQLFGEGR